MLSTSDAETLNAARKVLDSLASACSHSPSSEKARHGFALGRLAEAATHAEDAIFNALNVASSYLHDDVAAKAIVGRRP